MPLYKHTYVSGSQTAFKLCNFCENKISVTFCLILCMKDNSYPILLKKEERNHRVIADEYMYINFIVLLTKEKKNSNANNNK